MKQELTHELLISVLDYDPEAGTFTWRLPIGGHVRMGAVVRGCPDQDGYLRVRLFGRGYRFNRLAWFHMMGEWPRGVVDHKDGVVTNDKWSNLREATFQQNAANRRAQDRNKSGFKGVFWCSGTKAWRAQIANNGKSRDLGKFPSPEAANDAYVAEAEKVYGQFARGA